MTHDVLLMPIDFFRARSRKIIPTVGIKIHKSYASATLCASDFHEVWPRYVRLDHLVVEFLKIYEVRALNLNPKAQASRQF